MLTQMNVKCPENSEKSIFERRLRLVETNEVLERLKALSHPEAVTGAAHFGIAPQTTVYGIALPELRKLAKSIGKDQTLAENLWVAGVHEARILASLIAVPKQMKPADMDRWAESFDAWDVCDQCCINLFSKCSCAHQKVVEWAARDETYVKRAAFALIAVLASHDKKAGDAAFEAFLPLIQRAATDERNYVKKAVNWALRGIGKRNGYLNEKAIQTAREILQIGSKTARWIASDALRELTGDKVQQKLRNV
jgi:3-methyladenine DNA glycosylase AlkD